MTNFLPAGIINETISDISQRTAETRQHLAAGRMEEVARGLIEIENMALDLRVFIEGFHASRLSIQEVAARRKLSTGWNGL